LEFNQDRTISLKAAVRRCINKQCHCDKYVPRRFRESVVYM